MRILSILSFLVLFPFIKAHAQASFTAPDTVCVNDPVAITNTSVGATSYYWNFCVANPNIPPEGTNMGNIGGTLDGAVYIDYVEVGGNYYGFVTDNHRYKLYRLDFGASLLNTPTLTDLGTVNGSIPKHTEGIQVVQNEGKWYAIIVGGDPATGISSSICRIEFGTNIANNNPVGTNWGNIGGLSYPHDLYMFQDGGRWYGFTVNTYNNTATRLDFGTSFSNTPTGTNLGNLGNMDGPTGVFAIKDGAQWHVFVTNATSSSLTRLDFGTSLLNTPTGTNLGTLGGMLHGAWDIYIMKYCGSNVGFVINPDGAYNDLVKLDFGASLASTPSAVSFGNIGNMDFPHCLSKIFRVGADLYTFIPNVRNRSMTRLRFPGCTSSSLPNSALKDPAAIVYNTAGTYNINLTINEGLSTQSAYCRSVVVMPKLPHTPTRSFSFCEGDGVQLVSSFSGRNRWSTGSTDDAIYVTQPGTYWVETTNGACTNRDSFVCALKPAPFSVNLGKDTAFCKGGSLVLDAGHPGAAYTWQDGAGGQTFTVRSAGAYSVTVLKDGCAAKDTIAVGYLPEPAIALVSDTTICEGGTAALSASGGVGFRWYPADGLSDPGSATTEATPTATTKYYVEVEGANTCTAIDSVVVALRPPPQFSAQSSKPVLCLGDATTLTASGGDAYQWTPADALSHPTGEQTAAAPTETTQYKVVISDAVCGLTDSLFVTVPVVVKPDYTLAKSNDIDCMLGRAMLTATGGTQYSWTPTEGLSNPTAPNPVVAVRTSTTYKVHISTAEGCVVEDSIEVKVLSGNVENGYPVSNAFTPNGDGHNDCFGVRHWGAVTDFSLLLYDRWGQVVFQTNNPNDCWNGYYNGREQPLGVYVYYIRAKTLCGDVVRKGTFTLVR